RRLVTPRSGCNGMLAASFWTVRRALPFAYAWRREGRHARRRPSAQWWLRAILLHACWTKNDLGDEARVKQAGCRLIQIQVLGEDRTSEGILGSQLNPAMQVPIEESGGPSGLPTFHSGHPQVLAGRYRPNWLEHRGESPLELPRQSGQVAVGSPSPLPPETV